MTKLLNIILLTIILSSSCCCGETKQKLEPSQGVHVSTEYLDLAGSVQSDKEDPYSRGISLTITRFQLYGHDYISFQNIHDKQSGNVGEGVIHDPDCKKCKEHEHQMSVLTPETSDFWSW